jgi:hypothetical protein
VRDHATNVFSPNSVLYDDYDDDEDYERGIDLDCPLLERPTIKYRLMRTEKYIVDRSEIDDNDNYMWGESNRDSGINYSDQESLIVPEES